MSYTLALLRSDLRDHLGMDSTDLPDDNCDRLLNRSFWALTSKLRFNAQEGETSFVTVAGTHSYLTPTNDESVQRVMILDNDSATYTSLIKIDDWNMFPKQDDSAGDEDLPIYYSRRADYFILSPTPDDVYTIRVKYRMTLADIISSGPTIPREWHEVILYGALYRGFALRGDYNRSDKVEAKYASLINMLDTDEEKEVEDRRFSGVKPMRRRYI